MTYNIPTSSNYYSFFQDVNIMTGNNIPAISVIVIFFFLGFFGTMGAGKRPEVAFLFGSFTAWMTSIFVVIFMQTTAYLAVIPTLLVLASAFIAYTITGK